MNALLIYLVIYWVFSLCVLIALVKALRKEKAPLKIFVQAMGGVSLIIWDFFVLSIYLEQGTFIAAVLINALWLTTTHIQGYSLWYSFVSPIYATQFRDEKQIRRRFIATTIVCCCFYVAYGIPMAVVSASGDGDFFNLLTAIGFIIYVYVIFSASCLGILYHIEKLRSLCERVIQEHQQQQSVVLLNAMPGSSGADGNSPVVVSSSSLRNLELFLKRSRRLKRAVWVFFAFIAISASPFPVAYFVVGTLPFAWVFYFVMGMGPPTMCIGYIVFDRPERTSSRTLTATNSKGSSILVPADSAANPQ